MEGRMCGAHVPTPEVSASVGTWGREEKVTIRDSKGQEFRESLGQESNPGAATGAGSAWGPPCPCPPGLVPYSTQSSVFGPGRRWVAVPRGWPNC